MLQLANVEIFEWTVFRITSWNSLKHFYEDEGITLEEMNEVCETLGLSDQYKSEKIEDNLEQIEGLEEILIDAVFNRTSQQRGVSRFSNRDWAVFYSSLDEETAKKEIFYRFEERLFSVIKEQVMNVDQAMDVLKDQGMVHQVLFSCKFYGSIKDLKNFFCSGSLWRTHCTCCGMTRHGDDMAVGHESCTCESSELARESSESARKVPLFFCSKLIQNEGCEGGYQFCQQLGREAHQKSLGGLLAPSARRPGGINLPVFVREAVSSPQICYGLNIFYDLESDSVDAERFDL